MHSGCFPKDVQPTFTYGMSRLFPHRQVAIVSELQKCNSGKQPQDNHQKKNPKKQKNKKKRTKPKQKPLQKLEMSGEFHVGDTLFSLAVL